MFSRLRMILIPHKKYGPVMEWLQWHILTRRSFVT